MKIAILVICLSLVWGDVQIKLPLIVCIVLHLDTCTFCKVFVQVMMMRPFVMSLSMIRFSLFFFLLSDSSFFC